VDKDFGVQCNPREGFCIKHNRFVPVNVIDVAGLVPGAHEGKGMGNQFLNDLNQADALIHVIDCSGSTNEKGEPIAAGTYDPANDIKFLEEELDYWYIDILKKVWDKFSKAVTQTQTDVDKSLHKQFSGLGSSEEMIKDMLKQLSLSEKKLKDWSEDKLSSFAKALRKRTKPMVIAANKIDTTSAQENYKRLREQFSHLTIIPCSAESELALKEAAKHKLIEYLPGEKDFKIIGSPNDKQTKGLEFIKNNVLERFVEGTGVQQVLNNVVFELLKRIAIFPGGINKLEDQHGNVLPDCFLLPEKSTALDFAYRIHTDLGNGFIRAIDVKTKRTVGKEHLLKHLDVVEIISSK